ncbi:hypothetical protein ADIS_0907 [Lunatimonas lonarensis]|uniref:Uncharacterized protein n=1 Tax=Lunatimonas lonarensis TaxID=1232681 RepID=R7ZWV3_9BACT|nr:hypothetical protein [Lunatimonas lonarensis]EON78557.1 hypothetical protein ADIS_0907 [Lunatimonas lonarensis]
MENYEKEILKIDKEAVREITFSKTDVLVDEEAKKLRNHDLHRAQILGNGSKGKVSITFEAENKKAYQIETTIWCVGSQFITLKGGLAIPISSIAKVD